MNGALFSSVTFLIVAVRKHNDNTFPLLLQRRPVICLAFSRHAFGACLAGAAQGVQDAATSAALEHLVSTHMFAHGTLTVLNKDDALEARHPGRRKKFFLVCLISLFFFSTFEFRLL